MGGRFAEDGAGLGKEELIMERLPRAARNQIRAALKWAEEHGIKLSESDREWSDRILRNLSLAEHEWRKLAAVFDDMDGERREKHRFVNGKPTAWRVHWSAHGGDSARRKARAVIKRLDGHSTKSVPRRANLVRFQLDIDPTEPDAALRIHAALQRFAGSPVKGGPGSGHFGHRGRPGERGGSAPRNADGSGPDVGPDVGSVPADSAGASESDFPKSLAEIQVIKRLGGSTGAQEVRDGRGRVFVMKRGNSPDHILEESYADAAYQALGIPVPAFRMYDGDTNPTKLAQWIHGTHLGDLENTDFQNAKKKLQENLVADALLGTWDVIGLSLDNVIVTPDGTPWRIDNGGALRYRAQGKEKRGWGETVGEIWTMRDPRINRNGADVFQDTPFESILKQIDEILPRRTKVLDALPDPKLKKIVDDRFDFLEEIAQESDKLRAQQLSYEEIDERLWGKYGSLKSYSLHASEVKTALEELRAMKMKA